MFIKWETVSFNYWGEVIDQFKDYYLCHGVRQTKTSGGLLYVKNKYVNSKRYHPINITEDEFREQVEKLKVNAYSTGQHKVGDYVAYKYKNKMYYGRIRNIKNLYNVDFMGDAPKQLSHWDLSAVISVSEEECQNRVLETI